METHVYDLGDLDARAGRTPVPRSPRPAVRPAQVQDIPAPATRHPVEGLGRVLASGAMLLFPRSGRLRASEVAAGLLPSVWLAFLAALAWAVWETRERLAATLELFGVSAAPILWVWLTCGTLGAAVHVGSCVVEARRRRGGYVSPALAALVSAIVPGWGAWARGRIVRGAVLLAGLWALAGLWFVASAPFARLLQELRLDRPAAWEMLAAPAWRGAAAAALWAVSVYDAFADRGPER